MYSSSHTLLYHFCSFYCSQTFVNFLARLVFLQSLPSPYSPGPILIKTIIEVCPDSNRNLPYLPSKPVLTPNTSWNFHSSAYPPATFFLIAYALSCWVPPLSSPWSLTPTNLFCQYREESRSLTAYHLSLRRTSCFLLYTPYFSLFIPYFFHSHARARLFSVQSIKRLSLLHYQTCLKFSLLTTFSRSSLSRSPSKITPLKITLTVPQSRTFHNFTLLLRRYSFLFAI